jgi:hypothetical protein
MPVLERTFKPVVKAGQTGPGLKGKLSPLAGGTVESRWYGGTARGAPDGLIPQADCAGALNLKCAVCRPVLNNDCGGGL